MTDKISYEWRIVHNGVGKTPNIRTNGTSWLYKNNIWLACGASAGYGKTAEVWRFSLETKEWNKVDVAGGPTPRDGNSGTYVGHGKFVLFGGQGFPEPNKKLNKMSEGKVKTYLKREVYNDIFEFDCDNLTWTPIYPEGLSFPMGRRGHCACYLQQTKEVDDVTVASVSSKAAGSLLTRTTYDSSHSSHSKYSKGSHLQQKGHKNKFALPEQQAPPPVQTSSLLVFGGSGIELSKYTEQLYNDLWLFSFDTKHWTKVETRGIEPRGLTDHRSERVGTDLIVMGGIAAPPLPSTKDVAGPASTHSHTKRNGGGGAIAGSAGHHGTNSSSHGLPPMTDKLQRLLAPPVSDILVLNLETFTWSYLRMRDEIGKSIRFQFHGFSTAPDMASDPHTLFIFGGKESMDGVDTSGSRAPAYSMSASMMQSSSMVIADQSQAHGFGAPSPSNDSFVATTLTAFEDEEEKVNLFSFNTITGILKPVETIPMPPPSKEDEEDEDGNPKEKDLEADFPLGINLIPPVGSLLAGATYIPERRYAHVGIAATPVETSFEHFNPDHSKQHGHGHGLNGKKKNLRRNKNSRPEPEPTRFEPIMYIYGGASQTAAGGFCDPALFELVRIVVPAPIDTYLTFMSEMMNPQQGQQASNLNSAAAPGSGVTSPVPSNNGGRSGSPATSKGGSRPSSRQSNARSSSSNSRPPSPGTIADGRDPMLESFAVAGDHAFDQSQFEGSNSGNLNRGSIWENLQGKGALPGAKVKQPSNWQELKLALSSPLSNRYYESDLLKQQAFQYHQHMTGGGNNFIGGGGGTLGGSGSMMIMMPPNTAPPALGGSSSMEGFHTGAKKSVMFEESTAGGRPMSGGGGRTASGRFSSSAHMRASTAPSHTHAHMQSGHFSTTGRSANQQQLSRTQSTAASGRSGQLTPVGTAGGTANGGSRRRGKDEIAHEKAERERRLKVYSASLKPVVKNKTKVEARNEFLKLFPLTSPDMFSGSSRDASF